MNTILVIRFSSFPQGSASASSLTSMTAWKTCLKGWFLIARMPFILKMVPAGQDHVHGLDGMPVECACRLNFEVLERQAHSCKVQSWYLHENSASPKSSDTSVLLSSGFAFNSCSHSKFATCSVPFSGGSWPKVCIKAESFAGSLAKSRYTRAATDDSICNNHRTTS